MRMVKIKRARRFLCHKSRVHAFEDPEVDPGDYMIRFKFTLSMNLPSSLYFKNTSRPDEPKAKVKYYCKARLVCEDPVRDMTFKQVLVIREKPVTLVEDNTIEEV